MLPKPRDHRLLVRKVRKGLDEVANGCEIRKILLGLSGGADSSVLLHLLCDLANEKGFRLVAAHVHHGIRGEEADRDAEAAENLARKYGVEFHILRLTPEKGKSSAEHELRELRLGRLQKLARKLKVDRIALAHHLDDQAETFLLRLCGGTDLRGLSGMKPLRPPLWIRPLLAVTRREIEEEAERCGISYVIDSSNLGTNPRRNFVRKILIPTLRAQMNPQISEHLVELAESVAKAQNYLELRAKRLLKRAKLGQGRYSVEVLRKSPDSIRFNALQIAFQDMAGEGSALRRVQLDVVDHLVRTDGSERSYKLPKSVHVRRAKNWLRFGRND